MIAWFCAVALAVIVCALLQALLQMRKEREALQAQLREAQRILTHKSTLSTRRDISQSEYYRCLNRLGFTSLDEYQRSELWYRTKQRYRDSDYPQRCLVCGAERFELHHRTYERLGNEELFDLVPLCSVHHQQLHALLDRNPSVSVKDTHDHLIQLMSRDEPHEPCAQGSNGVPQRNAEQERSRVGKPWSAEEEAELLHCFQQGMTVEETAKRLRRGAVAVEVKWFILGAAEIGRIAL